MATPGEVVDTGGGDGQPRQQQRRAGGLGQSFTGIIRIAVFYYFASKFFSPKQKPADPSQPSQLMSNLFQKGERVSMRNSMTLAMKVHLFGTRQTYLMLCGSQKALGPCQQSIIHPRH